MLHDVAWVAGLFEGEGTIVVRENRTKAVYGLELSLASTDEDVVRLFRQVVGVGKIYGPYKYGENRKPYWKWQSYSGEDGVYVLEALLPYFLSRRATKAVAAIEAWEQRQLEPHYRRSRKGMGGKPTHRKVTA